MIVTLLLHYPEMSADDIGQEAIKAGMAAFDSFAEALDEAGVLLAAEMLQPSAATATVRRRDGDVRVDDGGAGTGSADPLGGFLLLDVADRAAALEWAGRAPSAEWGPVEVRPVAVRYVDGSWHQA